MNSGQPRETFGKKFQRTGVVWDTFSEVLNSDVVAKPLTYVSKSRIAEAAILT